ncbi:MAG: 3-dehydroquinate synthase [Gammaproteobacteria bacterium]|nr:3-dehydroquinate synthase [Gammaproteobacteria bacterium]
MRRLQVDLGEHAYPILIGTDLLADRDLLNDYSHSKQVMVVSNATIAPLYLEQLTATLGDKNTETLILPDGEQFKTLEVMNDIITRLLEKRFSRDCTLVALGGGVIGDITGFAAACYQLGVNYIQVPTTILAQVDSSVGGKTAVNHPLGKNMIGAFHQPVAVIADIAVLDTLPERELHAGLAEVIKYGLIRDPEFFSWLEENLQKLLARDPDALVYAIERSCSNKAEVVAEDEKEAGVRALLNLGHTFGHAIETGLGYRDWLHGEAVATGMLMAADLSCRHGWLRTADVERVQKILEAAALPVRMPASLDRDTLLGHMAVDKKAREGNIRLVLLEAIGKAFVTREFDPQHLQATIDAFLSAPGTTREG